MKVTTKLLLGATLIAGLSISAFAACANHVDMGTKKLTNVADGTDDKDAVNVKQALGIEVGTVTDANATAFTSYRAPFNIRLTKSASTVCLNGLYENVSGVELPASARSLGTITDTNFHPLTRIVSRALQSDTSSVRVDISQTGVISIVAGDPIPVNGWMSINTCWQR